MMDWFSIMEGKVMGDTVVLEEYMVVAARLAGIEDATEGVVHDVAGKARHLVTEQGQRIAELEAKVERVEKLPDKWRERNWHKSECDEDWQECANELEEALK